MRIPHSKLQPPRLGKPVIDRTWLFQGDEDHSVPVTLVSAPAGSGKTTLISRWAADRALHGDRVGWVSLDGSDNDPAVFWTGLLAAVHSAVPATSSGAGPPHGQDLAPGPLTGEPPLVDLELLVGSAPVPVWLFLDDLHEVHSADVLSGLAGLLRGLPDGLQLVLATRRDPAVALHRLMLAGRLREIRATDLALDRGEVEQVLAHHGVRLEDRSLSLLVDRTEGWAAGVRLAALTLTGATDTRSAVQDFVGDGRGVGDYLAAEVLAGLGTTDRARLRLIAVPEQLTSELAVSVTGDRAAAGLLERLYRDNAFVQRLVQPAGWYRLHSLLRGHLLAELRREDPELLATAHARTAEWFERHGHLVWSLGHGVVAGDDGTTTRMLVEQGPSLLADGRAWVLDRLIRSTTAGVRADPDVQELATVTSLELGPPSSSPIPAPRRPGTSDGPQPDGPWPDLEPTALGALASLQHARHGDLASSDAALAASAPVTAGRADDLGLLLRLNRGLVSLLAGDLLGAGSELAVAAARARQQGNDHALFQALAGRTALASSRGDYRAAWRLADETVRVAGRLGAYRSAGTAAALLQAAQSAYQRLDLSGARHLVERAEAAMGGSRDGVLELALTTLTAVLDVEDGRQPAEATRRIRDLWSRADGRQIPPLLVVHLAYAQHRCSWLVGRLDWADEALDHLRTRVGPGGELDVLLATEQLARGRGEGARKRLAPVLDGVVPCAHPLTLQQAWLVEAVVAAQSGQRSRCHDALQAALGIADELGALRAFLDMPRVPTLLDEDASRFARLDHVADTIRTAARGRRHRTAVPLTPKELELLTDLPAQLTMEDIADRHQVSVNTVKTHVRSIYLKLEAQNRREAIASARRLGLL